MRRHFISILLSFLFLVSSLFPSLSTAAPACFAWANNDGKGEINIYVSTTKKGRWQVPLQLTQNQSINITPTTSIDSNDKIAVVWIRRGDDTSSVVGVELEEGGITPEFEVPVPYTSNYSPSIVFDHTGHLWAAWSSYNGKTEDIYVSFRNNAQWNAPLQLSDNSTAPNILPTMFMSNDGYPIVSWQGLKGKNSHKYALSWNGEKWIPAENNLAKTIDSSYGNAQVSDIPKEAEGGLMGEYSIIDDNGFSRSSRFKKIPRK